MSDRVRSDWLRALIIFVSLSALGHHKFGTIDAIQRLAVTRAIFHRHSLVTPEFGAVKYGLLQPVLMLPSYAAGFLVGRFLPVSVTTPSQLGYRFTAFLFTPLVVTLTFVRYLKISRRLGSEPAAALTSAFLLVWGTLLLPYSRLLFSEPLNALLILLSFEAVLSLTIDEKPRIWPVFLWLSLLVLNNVVFTLLFALVFVAVVLWCRKTAPKTLPRLLGASLGFALASAALWALYNHARFGAMTTFGYGDAGFTGSLAEGLYVLTLSIGRGVVVYSPLSVVAFLFIALAWRSPALEGIRGPLLVFWLASALYLVLYGSWSSSEGGWCWGPRFLLPFVPVLHVAFPFVLSSAARRGNGARALLVAAVAAALLINAWEFLGVYGDYEKATFESGALDYRLSVFVPRYSALLNNWTLSAALDRLPQFFAAAAIGYGLLRWTLRSNSLATARRRTSSDR